MQVVHAAGGRRGESVESEVEGKNCGERRRFERGCDAAGQSSWEEIFLLASIPRTEANAIENEHQASPMFTYPVGHHGCAATGGAADDDPSFVVTGITVGKIHPSVTSGVGIIVLIRGVK